MEDQEKPEVGNNFKQFLIMWGQAASLLGLVLFAVIVLVAIILGVAAMFKFAGPLVGAIIFFVVSTLGITTWGWISGERP